MPCSQKLLASGVLVLKQRMDGVGHSLILRLDLFVVGFTQYMVSTEALAVLSNRVLLLQPHGWISMSFLHANL